MTRSGSACGRFQSCSTPAVTSRHLLDTYKQLAYRLRLTPLRSVNHEQRASQAASERLGLHNGSRRGGAVSDEIQRDRFLPDLLEV